MLNYSNLNEEIKPILKEYTDKIDNIEEFIDSVLELNALKISETLNVNLSNSLQIVKKILQDKLKLTIKTVLKTDDIQKMYIKIIKIIESLLSTSYAKNKINFFYPLPAAFTDSIKNREKYSLAAKEVINQLTSDDIISLKQFLSEIKPLKKPKILRRSSGRIIITDDKKILKKLEDRGINEFCDIFYIPSTEKDRLAEFLQNYESIIFLTDSSYYPEALDYSENVEILSSEAKDSEIVPEKIISFYTSNYKSILSSCKIVKKWFDIKSTHIENLFLINISAGDIDELNDALTLLTEEGDYRTGNDKTLDKYKEALSKLDNLLVSIESETNEYIKTKVTSSAVTIKGEQILNILKSSYDEVDGAKMKQYLPNEVLEIFDQAIRRAEDKIINSLKLESDESVLVDGIFPKEIRLPVEINRKRQQELEAKLRIKYSAQKYNMLKDLTKKLEKYIKLVNKLIMRVQEFDLFLGLGEFSRIYLLNEPIISSDYIGLSFKEGTNIFLREEEIKNKMKVDPIDYTIGVTPRDTVNQEKVIVLTGANSGGKSRCLELVAQISILCQMGLLVPSKESYNGLFDEIHFFAKSRSMVSAGALESSLKKFAKIASSSSSKLALFDEVEAMTESGAAARILAGFIDILAKNDKTCTIMVSHLAKDILKLVKNRVRVDGIEAEGLDENMNLIVNRKPRYNYLARSTPELIIERLYNLSKGAEKEFYSKILAEFKKVENT